MTGKTVPVVIVGAGPGGLATSAELSRVGIAHLVLERGDTIAHTWENLYDSLVLHTGKHMSALPGMRFHKSTPLFPSRAQFLGYLQAYARRFAVPVETGTEVTSAQRDGDGWLLHTTGRPVRTHVLVLATGIVASPRVPELPGRELFPGTVRHSVEYRRPDGYAGRRVLVVGVGNSGGEIGSELARNGARVTIAVRSGANVVPLQLAGIPIQYLSFLVRRLPRAVQEVVVKAMALLARVRRGAPVLPRPAHSPLDAIPLIGFHLVDAIREGLVVVKPGVDAFTARGVRFTDGSEGEFDEVILATGFTAALRPVEGLVQLDARGFARRRDRVISEDQPDLYVVGHNYDSTGGLSNIRRDSRLVAERLATDPRLARTLVTGSLAVASAG